MSSNSTRDIKNSPLSFSIVYWMGKKFSIPARSRFRKQERNFEAQSSRARLCLFSVRRNSWKESESRVIYAFLPLWTRNDRPSFLPFFESPSLSLLLLLLVESSRQEGGKVDARPKSNRWLACSRSAGFLPSGPADPCGRAHFNVLNSGYNGSAKSLHAARTSEQHSLSVSCSWTGKISCGSFFPR